MAMLEHRWSQRLDTDREAAILAIGNCYFPAHLCNVSLGGMYLETKASPSKNSAVQILLRVSDNGYSEWRRLHAIIVHRSTAGIGVLVDVTKPIAQQTLQKLLRHYRSGIIDTPRPFSPAARQPENQISSA